MLKIYVQDRGFAGMIIVIANSEEEARKKMENHCNYNKNATLESYDINEDFVYANYLAHLNDNKFFKKQD